MENKTINYSTEHTIEEWINIILTKFNDISLKDRVKDITTIFSVSSEDEINKIREASIIAFGRTIGITSYEDACNKLGKSPEILFIDVYKKYISQYKLEIIIRALNDGWYPNWEDAEERKYYNYFNMKGGFSYWGVCYDNTLTDVPSALFLKSEDLAMYCYDKFSHLYEEYYK